MLDTAQATTKLSSPEHAGSGIRLSENSLAVLKRRYLRKGPDGQPVETVEQMFRRVAGHVAAVEEAWGGDVRQAEAAFYDLITAFRFMPNSPTFTGAGTRLAQLAACFVLPVADDMGRDADGIFQTLRNAALIQQTGGGTGFSFSRLRPSGATVHSSGGRATGPVGFMRVFDVASGIVSQGGARRGANMAVLRVDHPDILEFIRCKGSEHTITNFNLSVGVTDDFMRAVEENGTVELVNPQDGEIWKTVRARELFDEIVAGAHRNGEPGMLFLDTANRENPCPHLGEYEASNPCGEQFLLPYENCCLGSVNLAQHVGPGNNGRPGVAWEKLRETVRVAVRFLDDVIDANGYVPAVPKLEEAAHRTRRIGLGIMGLGDLMYHLGVRYGSEEAQELAAQVMEFVRYHAMRASVALARERGPFPAIEGSLYDPDDFHWTPPRPVVPYTRLEQWHRPPPDWEGLVDDMRRCGIRNAAQTTVAPTGTIATVSGCEAYGCEPVFALSYVRHVNDNGRDMELRYISPIFLRALKKAGLDRDAQERILQKVVLTGSCRNVEELPPHIRDTFVVASDITVEEHVRMQAALQAFVDASISKCVTGDTLLFTERGILPIGDLYQNEPPDTFRTLNAPLRVADWGAPMAAQEFYFGGEQETICLMTDLGLRLEATPNHRVRVLEARGNIVWRRMDELRDGDYLVVPYDYPEALGRRYEFSQVYGTTYQAAERTVAKVFSWPYKITRDLARLLGYLTADGYIGQNWVQLSQSDDQVVEDARKIFRRCFDAEAKHTMDERREHLNVLQVNGRDLVRFFRDYLGMEGLAPEKHIPRCVTASGPWIARDYVRGLTLDGYVSPQGHVAPLTTMSERLARETQALLLALGVPARISQKEVNYEYKDERECNTSYVLTVLPEFRERFLEIIGFAEERKNEAAWNRLPPPRQRRGNQVPGVIDLCVALIKAKLPHVRSRRAEDYLRSTLSDLCQPDKQTLATDRICYILDLCADCADTDEYRQLARVTERKVVYTPVTSLSRGRAAVYDLHVPETNSFISNGLVSHNTINCPADATSDDVARAFKLAWELGCKGLTVYVTGSREKVVLETEATRKARQSEQQQVQGATMPKAVRRPRPHVLKGVTYRKGTPLGTAYVTVNANGGDEPFEVFLTVGKAGSDTAAVAEAIGRLISLVLRLPSPFSATRRLKQVVQQLKGIGGGRPLGFGRDRVRSLPDGVAQVLAEHLGLVEPSDEEGGSEQLPLFPAGDLCPECGHAALVKEEGCSRCYSCGYSEC